MKTIKLVKCDLPTFRDSAFKRGVALKPGDTVEVEDKDAERIGREFPGWFQAVEPEAPADPATASADKGAKKK